MDNKTIIGREKEQQILQSCLDSEESEFVAIYGRRRVGKTYLVRRFFNDNFAFFLTGMDNVSMQDQLTNFAFALEKYAQTEIKVPKNWLYAFDDLSKYLETLPEGKKVIFIDELPWLDTPKSRFLSALEHFWNSWASLRNDIKLITCGSATSWMLNELINNRGGLHNRLTHKILLEPFTLKECKDFFDLNHFGYAEREIAECYMVMGGVPFYMKQMRKGLSVAQNIDALFFEIGGQLSDEYQNLIRSLFSHSTNYMKILEAISSKGIGLTRLDILEQTDLPNNGGLTTMLNELQSCGFIREYLPIDKQKKSSLYQLIDPYMLFYFRFVKTNKYQNEHFWVDSMTTAQHDSWCGYAFEILCLNHIKQIKAALGIAGVETKIASWKSDKIKKGAQIDLLIDRKDDAINLCEMKYTKREFTITAKYEKELINKIEVFKEESKTSKSVRLTMITSKGLAHNTHSSIVQNELTLSDLFH